MENYLEKLWDVVTEKLGAVAAFIPAMAEVVKFAIKDGDVEACQARADQLDEAADQLKAVASCLRDSVADGEVSLAEGAAMAVEIEKMLDEWEDVVTGVDEDDAPE